MIIIRPVCLQADDEAETEFGLSVDLGIVVRSMFGTI